jgi:hypothetical protein
LPSGFAGTFTKVTSPTATGPAGDSVDSLLVFLTTSCVSCREHWESLAATPFELAPGARLVVVTPSRSMEDELLARSMTPAGAYLHMSSDTWFMYGVAQAGTSVLVRSRRQGPPPWAEAGDVLGSAAPSDLGRLPDLVRSWRSRTHSPAATGGGPGSRGD